MRRALLPSRVLGSLAMAATLALSTPGVKVARAQSSAADPGQIELFLAQLGPGSAVASASPPPAVCNAALGSPQKQEADLARALARVRERRIVIPSPNAAGTSGDPDVVVLNGRGFNYATTSDFDFALSRSIRPPSRPSAAE